MKNFFRNYVVKVQCEYDPLLLEKVLRISEDLREKVCISKKYHVLLKHQLIR